MFINDGVPWSPVMNAALLRGRTVMVGLLCLLLLAACGQSGSGGRRPKDTYFEGYDGVNVRLMPGSLPRTLYYYTPLGTVPGQPGTISADNTYQLDIEVANRGASDAFGAVFVSGFDPHLIQFQEFSVPSAAQNVGHLVDCTGSAATWISGILTGALSCNIGDYFNLLFGRDASTTRVGVTRVDVNHILVDLIPALRGEQGRELSGWARFLADLSHVTFDIVYDTATGRTSWGLNLAGPGGVAVGALDYGRGFILEIIAFHQARVDIDRVFALDRAKGAVPMGTDFQGFLVGDRPENPFGDYDIKSLHFGLKNWPVGLDKTEQHFLITSCYLYVTHANPVICLDPYPDTPGRKVCRPRTMTYPRGQGAPIAITSIEQENTVKDVFFTIHIENKGGGMVFNPLSMEVCNPYFTSRRVTARDLDVVRVHQIRIEGDPAPIRCQPESHIVRLRDGKGQISCRYPIVYRSQSAYQTPLVVELAYGYSAAIDHVITIKRAG